MLRTTMSLPNPAPLDDREPIRTLPSEAELIERARTDAGAFDAPYLQLAEWCEGAASL